MTGEIVQKENMDLEENKIKYNESVDDSDMIRKTDRCDDDQDEDDGDPDSDPMCTSEKLYQADQQHLRNILPEEIWLFILDKLKDCPEDLESCVNASPYFRELLSDARVIFLFPKVLNILLPFYEPRKWKMTRITGQDVEKEHKDLPYTHEKRVALLNAELEDRKWKKSILRCREVCADWNNSIHQCYQSPKFKFSFGTTEQAEKFMEHFENSQYAAGWNPENCFYGRYLCIMFHYAGREMSQEGVEECQNVVTRLLRMFGRGMWNLDLCLPLTIYDHREYYLKLREWFGLLPNLKILSLCYIISRFDDQTKELIAQNPLPKLENLEKLHLGYGCEGPIVTEVLRSNSHVKSLEFCDEREFDLEVGRAFPNLTNFATKVTRTRNSSFQMMQKYGTTWKIETARLMVGSDEMGVGFQVLENNWGNNLTKLELHCNPYVGSAISEPSKNLRLNLPHVRQLYLCIADYTFLDFILPMANCLESLEIMTDDPEDVSPPRVELRKVRDPLVQDQIIQFAGFERKMHQSNIWKVFTKLKTIKMEFIMKFDEYIVYTRKGEKLVYVKRQVF